MDTNDLAKLLEDRKQRFADALDQCHDRSPVAVAIIEELFRDVRELQMELLGDVEK